MPSYDSVAIVSEMLRGRLNAALQIFRQEKDVAKLHNLADDPPVKPVLAIFLYEVAEDPTLRNRGRRLTFDGVEYQGGKAPLPLILRYLMVPYAGDPTTEFLMLGRALQAMHEQSLTSSPELPAGLGPMEAVSITLAPLSLEERTRVWWAISKPYRLSVNYEARVVDVDVPRDEIAQPVGRTTLNMVGQDS